jgi:hypothetical protein
MAFLRCFLAATLGLVMLGCTANVTNTANVFTPVRGLIEVSVTIPDDERVTKVQFQLNNQVVAEDDNGTDGYTADIDTSGLEPGVLAKISAVGVRTDGTVFVLRENLILIEDRSA